MAKKNVDNQVSETCSQMSQRPRRLPLNPTLRDMVRENRLVASDMIYPLFVRPGKGIRQAIKSMPGVFQLSPDELVKEAEAAMRLGVKSVLLFGVPEKKDAAGSDSISDNGIIQTALRALKKSLPELYIVTDVCLCEYTDHGHCGVLDEKGIVKNDETLPNLGMQAISHAANGADMVAPSGMMDGMVKVMRDALDSEGFHGTPIMSYAVKYASGLYGPFRDAAECAPSFGDRRTHQMDPANAREALREVALDVEQGADVIMIKPAGMYLDIISSVRRATELPVAAYQVSGEYSMIKAASQNGWIDEQRCAVESLLSIKRAGANMIMTYYAKEILEKGWL